jgi:2-oxoglutarate dehydrogenase E2 component (dihydrolipoamide succinyltransferase)
VRRLVAETGVDVVRIVGSGKGGRLLKGDVLAALGEGAAPAVVSPPETAEALVEAPPVAPAPAPRERREPMSRLRRRLAERLKQAQNTAAMLTTFNEVDMTRVMALRAEYRDRFEQRHGVRLGLMSFFVKAAVSALREQPAVNAEIDGDDIVYKDYYNIGVAVAAPGGLVVPVVRDADRLSFAEIETTIADLGKRARDGKLTIDDMTGGTFTITNGGVFGSLLSTPILNFPQSGILGMHKIQSRPQAVGEGVEVRPMMYLALSYDHRIIDGREAVIFLVRIKECIEDPRRLLLDI